MSTVAERIAAGAAFLDEHDPGWWRDGVERAIDLAALNLAANDSCILGQRCPVSVLAAYASVDPDDEDEVSGVWYQAYQAYSRHLSGIRDWDRVISWSVKLGFNAEDTEFPALTAEWTRLITGRRSAA